MTFLALLAVVLLAGVVTLLALAAWVIWPMRRRLR